MLADGLGVNKTKFLAFAAGGLTFVGALDIPVRLGVDRSAEADKNVRAPKTHRSAVFDKSEMRPFAAIFPSGSWRADERPAGARRKGL